MDKIERANRAKKHLKWIEKTYPNYIDYSVKKTKIYTNEVIGKNNDPFQKQTKPAEIILVENDSVNTLFDFYENDLKIAVLNFASYRNPGGGFLKGSMAQEESLCHASSLYSCLIKFKDTFYKWNNDHLNNGLYTNRALYSLDIIFIDKQKKTIISDVITCAAPNRRYATRKRHLSEKENIVALKQRIRFILEIAKENKVNTLILGAFGCGVFLQEGKVVAKIFIELIENDYKYCFDKIVFAIIGNNYYKFKQVLDEFID